MKTFFLFTNRNTMVFDDDGEQDSHMQTAISCYSINKKKAQKILDSCNKFYISKWREWKQELSKGEMEFLLGLRTKKADLEKIKKGLL